MAKVSGMELTIALMGLDAVNGKEVREYAKQQLTALIAKADDEESEGWDLDREAMATALLKLYNSTLVGAEKVTWLKPEEAEKIFNQEAFRGYKLVFPQATNEDIENGAFSYFCDTCLPQQNVRYSKHLAQYLGALQGYVDARAAKSMYDYFAKQEAKS